MTKIRQWSLLTVGIIALVFMAGWFLAISPQHSHASSLRKDQAQQEQANQELQTTLARLTAQSKNVVANQARLAAIAKELPATPDLAVYVRALTAAAAATNVDLVSISPGTPTAVSPPKAAAPVAPPAPSAGAATGKAAPAGATASAAPGVGVGAAPAGTGATAGSGASAAAAGLQAISVSIVVNGDYFALEQFLTKLQTMQRATIVSSVNLSPSAALVAAGATAPSGNNAWKTIGASISLTIFEGAATPTIVAPAAPLAAPVAPGAAVNPSAATN